MASIGRLNTALLPEESRPDGGETGAQAAPDVLPPSDVRAIRATMRALELGFDELLPAGGCA